MKILTLAIPVLLFAAPAHAQNPYLQKALEEKYGSGKDSIVVLNARTGHPLAAIHSEAILQESHPPGSLIKVFTAIAFAEAHGDAFPKLHCPSTLPGDPAGCWDRNGHGLADLEKAIANSCNVYFRQLAKNVEPEAFAEVVMRFGIIRDRRQILSFPESTQRKLMVGNTLEWSTSPILILRAYCALYNEGHLWSASGSVPNEAPLPAQRLLDRIRNGMRRSGETGTSLLARRESGVPLLGKTGTSLQMAGQLPDWRRTQGWWIGLYPVEHPEIAVMTFARHGRGATDAAPLGGRALAEFLKLSHGN